MSYLNTSDLHARTAVSAVALALSLATLASPSFAQQAEGVTEGEGDSDVIIVEARRRDENVQDVPLVVNTVTAQSLSKLNIRDFKDIASVVPGLSLTPAANGVGSASSLRGVNHDVNISGDNGTIQYYLDDAPTGSDTVFQTLFDLGQIEVLRGPQGTLRGRATPSGSITVTTRKPDLHEAGAYVDGTLGSASLRNLNFGIGVPIIRDMLAVRVAGIYDHNGGDRVTSVNSTRKPFNESKSLRASVLFQPVDWFKAGFTFTTLNREGANFDQAQSFSLTDPAVASSAGAPNYGTISLADRKSVEFSPRTVDVRFKRYAWNSKVSFAGQDLIYVGSYQHTQFHPITPNDKGGRYPSLALTNLQDVHTDSTAYTHEIRLQNSERVMGMFDYVLGYFRATGGGTGTTVATQQVLSTRVQVAPGFFFSLPTSLVPVAVSLTSPPGKHGKEESYFGNLTVHLGDRTELAGGLRHIEITDPGLDTRINGALAVPAASGDFSTTIYNFTARHRFSDDLMVYASTGSSARAGARNFSFFSPVATSNVLNHIRTKPETSKSYEIGVKSDWFDKKVLFNLTYYHQTFKNYGYASPSPGIYYLDVSSSGANTVGVSRFVNGVPVKVDGVEAEFAFRPSHNFNLSATVDWSKSKMGAAELACNVLASNAVPTVAQLQALLPAGQNLAVCNNPGGGTVNFQAPWNGTIQSEYSHDVGSKVEAFARGLVSWHGASKNDPDNPYDNVGAYAMLNAYAGLRDADGAWTLTFYGKNLANTTKLTQLDSSPYSLSQTDVTVIGGTPTIGSSTNISRYGNVAVTAPREFGVNLRVAIGSR